MQKDSGIKEVDTLEQMQKAIVQKGSKREKEKRAGDEIWLSADNRGAL